MSKANSAINLDEVRALSPREQARWLVCRRTSIPDADLSDESVLDGYFDALQDGAFLFFGKRISRQGPGPFQYKHLVKQINSG